MIINNPFNGYAGFDGKGGYHGKGGHGGDQVVNKERQFMSPTV